MPLPSGVKEQDVLLWKKWKKDPSKENASIMVNHLLPLVKEEVFRYSNNMPYNVVEAHAKGLILQACQNFDPKQGAELSTFIRSYMIKLNQLNEAWRSPIKIPAHRAYKYNTFKNTFETLAQGLDRDPNIHELADELSWSKAEVERFMKEIRREFTDDRPFMTSYNPKQSLEKEIIDFIYHDLTAQEKILFEYTTGYGGKPVLDNTALGKRLGMSSNQLSYEKRKLIDKVNLMLQEK